jgi:hypothetical protein
MKSQRLEFSQITLGRVISGMKVRLREIPHTISWNINKMASENRECLSRYQGVHAGKRCFIVANGPSLLKTDLDLLKNEFTFGLNRIYLNFKNSSFRPTYYVAMNELILEQFYREISDLELPKFLNWNRRSYYTYDCPKSVFIKSKFVFNDFFQVDITRPLVVGASVTFVALQIAYYMGFNQVILVGLDHNYADKGTPNKTEVRKDEKDKSHFNEQYFPMGVKWQLPDLLRSEHDFSLARKSYEQIGGEVLDATIDGKCQVFTKVNYLNLFD